MLHNRYQKNESTLVLNRCRGGSFLESALNSWGLPIEDLLHNVACQVNEEAKNPPHISWPLSIANLSKEFSQNFFTKFVGWLIKLKKKEMDLTPEVYAMASLLQSLVTNKRTEFQVLWTSIIYGLTRSRKLFDLSRKFGFAISYQDVKYLLDSWARDETENNCCPSEIADEYPAVVVMDNNDFKMDTLTGASETNHRTDVMFVQNENLVKSSISKTRIPTLINPKDLKKLVEELNKVHPYKTTSYGDPTIRSPFPIDSPSTNYMRGEQLLHSLTRITKEGDNIPPESQNIGSFAGFQALLCNEVTKSKPYY